MNVTNTSVNQETVACFFSSLAITMARSLKEKQKKEITHREINIKMKALSL